MAIVPKLYPWYIVHALSELKWWIALHDFLPARNARHACPGHRFALPRKYL